MRRNGSWEEEYQCGDCFYIGGLNVHGRCGRCGSDAVISQHVLKVECSQSQVARAQGMRDRAKRMRRQMEEKRQKLA